jgi:hypothetical protein
MCHVEKKRVEINPLYFFLYFEVQHYLAVIFGGGGEASGAKKISMIALFSSEIQFLDYREIFVTLYKWIHFSKGWYARFFQDSEIFIIIFSCL